MYGPYFVLAIIAIIMLAKVMTTAIRAKHGYPIDDDGRRGRRRSGGDERHRLEEENRLLGGHVERLEQRLAVLERIATDPGRRLSDEIEGLRDGDGTDRPA